MLLPDFFLTWLNIDKFINLILINTILCVLICILKILSETKNTLGIFMMLKGFQANLTFETEEYVFAFNLLQDE